MPVYYRCHGLPGCGKSTWATSLIAENNTGDVVVRINRDMIRKEMFGYEANDTSRTKGMEGIVTKIQNGLEAVCFDKGLSIVSDNTNGPLGSVKCPRDYKVVDVWFDVSLEECLRRDAARDRVVGDKVIRGMAERYPWFIPGHPKFGSAIVHDSLVIK